MTRVIRKGNTRGLKYKLGAGAGDIPSIAVLKQSGKGRNIVRSLYFIFRPKCNLQLRRQRRITNDPPGESNAWTEAESGVRKIKYANNVSQRSGNVHADIRWDKQE